MRDPDGHLSRRSFLLRISFAAAAAPVFAACRSQTSREVGTATAGLARGDQQAFSCTDVSGLTDEQKQTRKSLQYVDSSPHSDKRCNNCQLFKAPAAGKECGTCQVVAGPIHPKGYCTAWTASG